MKCTNEAGAFSEDLGALLDGELDGERDAARRAEVEQHLETCESCREELARLRKLSALVGAMPRASAPGGILSSVMSSARREREAPARPKVLHLRRWIGALSAAAAVLLVGIVGLVGLRDERPGGARGLAPAAPAFEAELAEGAPDAAGLEDADDLYEARRLDKAPDRDRSVDLTFAKKAEHAPADGERPSAAAAAPPAPAVAPPVAATGADRAEGGWGSAGARATSRPAPSRSVATPAAKPAAGPVAAPAPARPGRVAPSAPGATVADAADAAEAAGATTGAAGAGRPEGEKLEAKRKAAEPAARGLARGGAARRERGLREKSDETFVGERLRFGENAIAGGGGAGAGRDAGGGAPAAEAPRQDGALAGGARPGAADAAAEAPAADRDEIMKEAVELAKQIDRRAGQAGKLREEESPGRYVELRLRIVAGDRETEARRIADLAKRHGGRLVGFKANADATAPRGGRWVPVREPRVGPTFVRVPAARAEEFIAAVRYQEAEEAGRGRAAPGKAAAGPPAAGAREATRRAPLRERAADGAAARGGALAERRPEGKGGEKAAAAEEQLGPGDETAWVTIEIVFPGQRSLADTIRAARAATLAREAIAKEAMDAERAVEEPPAEAAAPAEPAQPAEEPPATKLMH